MMRDSHALCSSRWVSGGSMVGEMRVMNAE
jgi:hypothetical protein